MDDCNVTLNICTSRPEKLSRNDAPAFSSSTELSLPVNRSFTASELEHSAYSDGGKGLRLIKKPVRNAASEPSEKASRGGQKRLRSTATSVRKRHRSSDDDGEQPAATGQKSSSLFSCNPHVPALSLQEPEVDGQTSTIFSDQKFSELAVHPHLATNVARQLEHERMTEVQQRAIPRLLDGHDCLIRAPTGTGKTLCYALPVVHTLQAIEPAVTRLSGLLCLVIVPTHELARQTQRCFQSLTKAFIRLVCGCVCGGDSLRAEKRALRRGLSILIATPGRLLQHLENTQCLSLSKLRWLVFDEADLLLDMGYKQHVNSILSAVKEQRVADVTVCSERLQTVLLSATLDDRVKQLAGLSLKDPVTVSLCDSITSGINACPEQLQHWLTVVPAKLRLVTLNAFLLHKIKLSEGKIVVFVGTADMVDFHAPLLKHCLNSHLSLSVKVFSLHGNMARQDRVGMLSDFSKSNPAVLVCTDVAARGLDVPRVDWIVQYTPPPRAEDYVHRAGRTARAGRTGSALLFLTPAETEYTDTLKQLGISVRDVCLESILSELAVHCLDSCSSIESAATQLQLAAERLVNEDEELQQLACRAFSSLVRAYGTYPVAMRRVFCVARLHLGHYAKSLALRHTPSQIARQQKE